MPLAEHLLKNRDKILAIAKQHGVTSVKVFGSAARGQVDKSSDLDLLVEVGEIKSPWFPGGLIADLEDMLGRRVDIAEPDTIHRSIRDQVLSEAVPL